MPQTKRIGEILLEKSFITELQLEHALKIQKALEQKQLGQILLDLGYITKAQLGKAIAIQRKIKRPRKR